MTRCICMVLVACASFKQIFFSLTYIYISVIIIKKILKGGDDNNLSTKIIFKHTYKRKKAHTHP